MLGWYRDRDSPSFSNILGVLVFIKCYTQRQSAGGPKKQTTNNERKKDLAMPLNDF